MDKNHPIMKSLQLIADDIRTFIDLSLKEPDESWHEWAHVVIQDAKVRCWEKKNCEKKDCPAYRNEKARCWLVAGTMCEGRVQGVFALKYGSCKECDVYQSAVFLDPVTEVYEHLITLVHSLRQTQEKLMTLATRDALTGAYNRNFFNEIIMNEIQRSKRYGDSFSLVMLDIDGFKRINDEHGHLLGDWVLKECAAVLCKCTRISDILVRYGGDEFMIVTPETGSESCEALIARVNNEISAWNENNAGDDCRLSVSIGCAMFHAGGDLMAVIQEADENMYRNKMKTNGHRDARED